MRVVPRPKNRESTPKPGYKPPLNAEWMLSHVIYLPVQHNMTLQETQEVIRRTINVSKMYQKYVDEELGKRSSEPLTIEVRAKL